MMILAFAVIGGFIYWLTGQVATERELEIAEDSTAAMVDDPYAEATPITAQDIMLDASPYVGQLVRLSPQTVSSLVGQQGFTLDFPSGPFLVSYSDQQIADSVKVMPGEVVRVTGRIQTMTPEVGAAWQAAGRLTEAERMVAEFAVHYLQAEDIEVSTAAPASAGNAPAGNSRN